VERSQVSQLLPRSGFARYFARYFATVAGARATGTMFTVSGVLLIGIAGLSLVSQTEPASGR
jgi:hypothetical protein